MPHRNNRGGGRLDPLVHRRCVDRTDGAAHRGVLGVRVLPVDIVLRQGGLGEPEFTPRTPADIPVLTDKRGSYTRTRPDEELCRPARWR
jgi:hypothetical protein